MESIKKKKAKQTPPPGSAGGDGEDRISSLNDDLRELILRSARLNVKELVRTSVLSKRWRGLWKRFPVLDFFGWPELESAGDVRRYIAIVNDVLEQIAGATSEARIDELKIPLVLREDSIRVRREQLWTPAMKPAAVKAAEVWIRYAMQHQVKAFQLNLRLGPAYVEEVTPVMDLDELLPSSPKLERLCLGLGDTEVRLPRTAVFTSLKDLTLESVKLAAGSCQLLARLLSSVCCPSLQKLCLRYFDFRGAENNKLVLKAGQLLELSMEVVHEMELLELRTPKLLYLNIDDCEHFESLRISAPGLKELTYFKFFIPGTVFIQGGLRCVERLKIDLYTHMEEGHNYEQYPNRSNIYLLKLCRLSVRCLLVHLYVPPEEYRHADLIKDNIPQLPNVTSLSVNIGVKYERHSFGDGVAGLLTRFKHLEYLSLVLDFSPDIGFENEYEYYFDVAAKVSPYIGFKEFECYLKDAAAVSCNHPDHWNTSDICLPKLREADFRGMSGTGCEIRFLQFVLASATDLQSVTVSFNLCFTEEEVQDIRMDYFLYSLLGGGTWTTCENEDSDKPYNCSKLYKWAPSP